MIFYVARRYYCNWCILNIIEKNSSTCVTRTSMLTTLLLFEWRVWGCPTSKHCVWIVFTPLTQWGGACPKHSLSIVSTTVFFFFFFSLHLGFFISSFKNLNQPLQFTFHSYLVHVILITNFLFWIVHDIIIFFISPSTTF